MPYIYIVLCGRHIFAKNFYRGIFMEIKRDFYLQKLLLRKHNRLVKVITGVRRCGKSYLLNTIFKRHLLANGVPEDHIIEVAFDDKENEAYRDPDAFYPYAKSRLTDGAMHYFLLDEVQMLRDFEGVLNGLIHRQNADVYVTGSNAKFLSRDVISEFRGRGDEVHLSPLSFAEFMSVYDGDKRDGWEEYMLYGGLPTVVLATETEHKMELLNSLFSETYISDILSRHKIKNVGEFEDLLNFLSSNIGSLTNPSKLSDTFRSVKKSKITPNTISKYIGHLEEAYLLASAKRYDVKGRGYIGSPMKYYYVDLGLRNSRLEFSQLEPTHSLENIIYNELRCRGFNVAVGLVPFAERNSAGIPLRKQFEVDFVASKGSKRYYIQAAYMIPDERKREQELRALREIGDSFKKILVTYHAPAPLYNSDGIMTINIFDFLLKENSLDL